MKKQGYLKKVLGSLKSLKNCLEEDKITHALRAYATLNMCVRDETELQNLAGELYTLCGNKNKIENIGLFSKKLNILKKEVIKKLEELA